LRKPSFRTLTLLVKSDASPRIIGAYLAGRLRRSLSRVVPAREAGNPLAAAKEVFERNTLGLEFSHTWFDGSIPLWVKLLSPMRDARPDAEMLEIGSWEGRSSVFLLGFFPQGHLTAVDTWAGGDEHRDYEALGEVERRFDRNVAQFGSCVSKRKGSSSLVLAQLAAEKRECFDLVFVDGSHFADDVMLDAVYSWRLLRQDGIMIFDDYLWRFERYGWKRNPAKAVNHFLGLVEGDFELLHVGHQLALRKTVSLARYTDR